MCIIDMSWKKKKHAFNFSFNFYWIIEENILQDL